MEITRRQCHRDLDGWCRDNWRELRTQWELVRFGEAAVLRASIALAAADGVDDDRASGCTSVAAAPFWSPTPLVNSANERTEVGRRNDV